MPTATPQEFTCVKCEQTFNANPTQQRVDDDDALGKTTISLRVVCANCGWHHKVQYDIPQS